MPKSKIINVEEITTGKIKLPIKSKARWTNKNTDNAPKVDSVKSTPMKISGKVQSEGAPGPRKGGKGRK